jgi:hypothetical protein
MLELDHYTGGASSNVQNGKTMSWACVRVRVVFESVVIAGGFGSRDDGDGTSWRTV